MPDHPNKPDRPVPMDAATSPAPDTPAYPAARQTDSAAATALAGWTGWTGWIDWPVSELDRAFAGFLQAAQPSQQPLHALLAALASHQFGRGHACLDLDLLGERGPEALGWDMPTPAAWPPAANWRAAAASLPWASGAHSPLVLQGARLYLRRNWQAEQQIMAALRERLQASEPSPPDLAVTLAALFPASSDAPGRAAGPDWQKIACAVATRARFTLITGGPGTGKTTTVARLLALLQSAALRQGAALRLALAAPTGKAAARLGEAMAQALQQLPPALAQQLPTQASTLHQLLQIRPDGAQAPAAPLALDLLVVDEASMVSLDLMARLLQALPAAARLVLLGDKDQLASVEAGAVLGQLCAHAEAPRYSAATLAWMAQNAGLPPGTLAPAAPASALAQQTVMLRHSRRFAATDGIGQWAQAVNAGDSAALRQLLQAAPPWTPDTAAVVDRVDLQDPHDARLMARVQQGWRASLQALRASDPQHCSDAQALALLRAQGRFQVLCALRAGPLGVLALNRRIAQALGYTPEGWYAGRPVMVLRNDPELQLMNGDVGLCLPRAQGLRVAFGDGQGGVRWVLPARLDAVESVFAMTVHKAQGSEFDEVCLVLPAQRAPVLTRELVYTGLTRARTRLSLALARPEVLLQAVQCQVLRSGGLTALHQD